LGSHAPVTAVQWAWQLGVSPEVVRERQEGPTPPYSLLFHSPFCCLDKPLCVEIAVLLTARLRGATADDNVVTVLEIGTAPCFQHILYPFTFHFSCFLFYSYILFSVVLCFFAMLHFVFLSSVFFFAVSFLCCFVFIFIRIFYFLLSFCFILCCFILSFVLFSDVCVFSVVFC
jgi:hypothetical protein